MKNIHVLPTENSSRLSYNKDGVLELHRLQWRKNTQNIYITSDEEIENCWFINLTNNEIGYIKNNIGIQKNAKKICLTTDQDLIKDGVQAIDNDFLEWFIKNTSCEEVEVIYEPKNFLDTKQGWEYVIIPKEEPKQETLEESLKKELEFTHDSIRNMDFDLGFKTGSLIGAKWQQEQDKKLYSDEKEFYKYMAKQDSWKSVGLIIQEFIQLKLKEQDKKLYSEEEVLGLLLSRPGPYLTDEEIKEWFEQFKKK